MRFNPCETHHGYYGLILIGLSYLFSSWLLYGIGAVLLIDDTYQHIRQEYDEDYYSPIHRIYIELLWRFEFIRELNRKLDKLMGKK